MKKFVFGLIALFLVGLVSATSDANGFKNGSAFNLTVFAVNSSGSPVTSALCNLDLWAPNDTLLLDNVSMTEFGSGFYKYLYTPMVTGEYQARFNCQKSGNITYGAGVFLVSTNTTTELIQAVTNNVSTMISNLANLTAGQVWNYADRNITYFDYATQSTYVWNFTQRNLSYTDYVTMQSYIWNATDRNLTYYDKTIVDYGYIQSMVWNASNRNLTFFDFAYLQSMVWNASNRNLTYFDYLTASTYVWNATGRNLTWMDWVDLQNYVWNASSRNLTWEDWSKIQMYVWNSTDRNLTYYPTSSASVDYEYLQVKVWNATNRNLTYFDYSGNAIYVWNSTDRNLTYYADVANYSLIGIYVWNETTRNLTYFPPSSSSNSSDLLLGCLKDANCTSWWVRQNFLKLQFADVVGDSMVVSTPSIGSGFVTGLSFGDPWVSLVGVGLMVLIAIGLFIYESRRR